MDLTPRTSADNAPLAPRKRRTTWTAIAVLAVLEIPLVHFSVVLWRSLHQRASVLSADGDVKMDGLMLFTLLVGVVGFTATFVWLVTHRQRVLAMRDVADARRLDVAIADRTQGAS